MSSIEASPLLPSPPSSLEARRLMVADGGAGAAPSLLPLPPLSTRGRLRIPRRSISLEYFATAIDAPAFANRAKEARGLTRTNSSQAFSKVQDH